MPILLAFAFLTRYPLDVKPRSMRDLAAATAWFPLAGVLVAGAGILSLLLVSNTVGRPLGAIAAIAAITLFTGGLHLQGLASCFRALLTPGDRARRAQALHEPANDPTTLALLGLWLLARCVLLWTATETGEGVAALWAACITSRAVIAAEIYQGPPATPGAGAYAAMHGSSRISDAVIALVTGTTLVVPLLVKQPQLAPALAVGLSVGLLASVLWHATWRHLVGGLTGAVVGGAVEIRELVLLACFVSPILAHH